MFKSTLEGQLRRIFGLDKVTFDIPGESNEQEGLFVDVKKANVRIKDARQIADVKGVIHVFAVAEKLPYGYFTKAIAEARPEDTKNLFFFNFEENRGKFRNIVERSMEFLYFFDSQYDPAIGTITSVDLAIAENL